ncbi:MAG: O-antigen ligase family protein [Deltaproteobacteria bacterium]|nr:O-antigen ligase family protein [Deltaproteobacteria bacterium]
MGAPALPLKENFPCPGARLELIIERGLQALLILTPLAFGTVHRWSQSLMEAAAFTLLGAMLLKRSLCGGSLRLPKKLLFIPLALFALLAVIQILPLPESLLAYISPETAQFHRTFAGANLSGPMTISVNPGATIEELLKFLAYAAVFFVTIDYCETTEHINRLLRTVVCMGAGLVVLAVAQKMTWNGRLYWFYPLGKNVPPNHNIWGPYINRNHFAGYMELAVPIALGCAIYMLSTINALSGSSFRKNIARVLSSRRFFQAGIFFLAALIMEAALFMTLSRGGFIGSAVSIAIFGALAYARRSLRKALWIIAAPAAVIIMIIFIGLLADTERRFMTAAPDQFARLDIWIDSLNIIKDYPFFGMGLGAFKNAFMSYQTKWSLIYFEHAESDYVELVTETGLVGLLIAALMTAAFFYPVLSAWRRQSGWYAKCIGAGGLSALSALFVHGFTDFNLRIPANALTFTVIAAATYAAVLTLASGTRGQAAARHKVPAATPAPAGMPAKKPIGRRRAALTALTVICTLGLVYLPVKGLLAEHYHAKAYNILDDKTTGQMDIKGVSKETLPDYAAAIRSLETAIALSPSRADYYKDLSSLQAMLAAQADAMESAGARIDGAGLSRPDSYKKAIAYMKEAIRMEPSNPDYHFSLGKLYAETGSSADLSDGEFKAALAAYPVNAPLRFAAAMHYLLGNRPEDAIKEARILAEIDDSYVIGDPEKRAFEMETNALGYRARLSQSFLAMAFEIVWRASNKDLTVVKAIIPAPDTHPQADDVFQIFLEAKGLDDR